jgi:hypothetical protein
MGGNPDPVWELQDIAELASCLRRGDTIEDAAKMLGRDDDQVRQKAYDLGFNRSIGCTLAVTRSPLLLPKPSRHPSSSEIAPWPLPASQFSRAVHRRAEGNRPEPAQAVRPATCPVDAADTQLAAVDCVIRGVLIDPGAKAGGTKLEGHINVLVGASTTIQAKGSPPPPSLPL